ncbi:LOW QUALITY PROTEIN: hypothetical protein HID58_087276, partial [Brassica napus]
GIHPTASGFQDESPSSLRVPGRESIQPPSSRTKVHLASGFQDESPSSLQDKSPLQLLQAQEAQARPIGSNMRILSFGLRVLLNLLIPLILSLAKILPLRIFGTLPASLSNLRPTLTNPHHGDAPGFSIKPLANSDQSPPWGQHLILIKEKKKVLQGQLDPTRQSSESRVQLETKHMPIEACLPRLCMGSRIIAHSPGDISPIRLRILSDRPQVHPSTIDK